MESRVHGMLQNLNIIHELGRQRCFELGNPFYYQDAEDNGEPGNENDTFYRKELYTGEIYLVEIDIFRGPGQTYQINDRVIRRIQ